MIMEELEDVDKAIEFAKEQDDAELWEDLISYSIDKPRMASHDSELLFQHLNLSLHVLFCCLLQRLLRASLIILALTLIPSSSSNA